MASNNTAPGVLYLIPNRLGKEADWQMSIPVGIKDVINKLNGVIAENVKRARDFLQYFNWGKSVLEFPVIGFYQQKRVVDRDYLLKIIKPLLQGEKWGMVSDCGCPGIADPGAELVRLAHQNGVKVIPLVGPSAIFLALMASGLSGQSFVFHGYLPLSKTARFKLIKQMENQAQKLKQTQIFMETPFRNEMIFNDLTCILRPETSLCLAMDITFPRELIITRTIREWRKKSLVDLQKRPAVFLVGGKG
jgi:16S rRNA (cytidine1402-2'-O)-methyltransferase